jgi:hypothetical protein
MLFDMLGRAAMLRGQLCSGCGLGKQKDVRDCHDQARSLRVLQVALLARLHCGKADHLQFDLLQECCSWHTLYQRWMHTIGNRSALLSEAVCLFDQPSR